MSDEQAEDVNLSPRWVDVLGERQRAILLSCDLDFGAILAAMGASGPSVIQIRGKDVLPEVIAERVAMVLFGLERELQTGALVSIDTDQARVRVLPLRA